MRKISLILLLMLLIPMASANSITFVDPLDNYKYFVYHASNGTYVGEYSTNDTLTFDNDSYIIHVKPNAVNIIQNPTTLYDWFVLYTPAFLGAGILLGMALIFVYLGKKVIR